MNISVREIFYEILLWIDTVKDLETLPLKKRFLVNFSHRAKD